MTLESREALDLVYKVRIVALANLTKSNISFGKIAVFWKKTPSLLDKWSRLSDAIAPIQISASPLLMHISMFFCQFSFGPMLIV
jgi:hypothetical protein